MMVDRFLKNIKKRDLFSKNDRIIIAVSGGVDSMVLLYLMKETGYDIGLAHCNFKLRENESDDDEAFVRKKAKEFGITGHFKSFNTKQYADERKISIQMAARELRYVWFEEIRKSENYTIIATAHHHNDNIETVIFNFIKGTGLAGMAGIPEQVNNIVRPLSFLLKSEIEAYARIHNIEFRLDKSNLKTDYNRNFIRHNVVTDFVKVNPGFESTSISTLDRLSGTNRFIRKWLKAKVKLYVRSSDNDIIVDKELLRKMQEPAILYEFLKDFGFNYDQSVQVMGRYNASSGKIFKSERYILNIDRNNLIITQREENDEFYRIKKGEESCVLKGGLLLISETIDVPEGFTNSREEASFDLDKISFPLSVRNWNSGDWFIPLGMKGKKKLSDFMIDNKIPLNLKKRVMVLTSGRDIIWIIGHRVDDRYKITGSTRRVLNIKLKKND